MNMILVGDGGAGAGLFLSITFTKLKLKLCASFLNKMLHFEIHLGRHHNKSMLLLVISQQEICDLT